MKKFKILFTIFLFLFGVKSVFAFNPSLKIYDYAQELSPTEEKDLKKLVDNYIENYNMDMVLVTVKYHTKNSTKQYAQDFYDYNGFGIGDTNDGILFVIDFTYGNRNIEIVTTGEAIKMYDDYRINKILDDITYKKDTSYYNWFKIFIDDASSFAKDGVPSSNKHVYIDKYGNPEIFPWPFIIITSLIVPTIVIIILIFKNRMVRKHVNANFYINENSLNITTRSDKFITTHTTSVRINDSSSSGGRIGGSSVSRGSSGVSHGGGGRSL